MNRGEHDDLNYLVLPFPILLTLSISWALTGNRGKGRREGGESSEKGGGKLGEPCPAPLLPLSPGHLRAKPAGKKRKEGKVLRKGKKRGREEGGKMVSSYMPSPLIYTSHGFR